MNFWEFLSQPVMGTPKEYETFWEGVNKRKQMKQQRVVEEHKHVHFHYDEIEKRKEKIQQLQQEIEELTKH